MSRDDIGQILVAARLRHSGYTIQKIAAHFGISRHSAEQLLRRTSEFVELRYCAPRETELEIELISRFNLAEAVVVETGDEKSEIMAVAHRAARYFIDRVKTGNKIALSCGETLLQMLHGLPFLPGLRLSICQLSIEADPTTIHQAPATLVGLLRSKVSPNSDAYGLQLPPVWLTSSSQSLREEFRSGTTFREMKSRALASDLIFIGIGSLMFEANQSSGSFLSMAEKATSIPFISFIQRMQLVGEINNQVYDEYGIDKTTDIPELTTHFINLVSLDELRQIAQDHQRKPVIAVAAGRRKRRAIATALRSGFINVLITGRSDAEGLLTNE